MPELLTSGCMLTCSFGASPAPFNALELPGKPLVAGLPAAAIDEIVPLLNVPSFIMCRSEANPEVAAATAAAEGVLTPMPCEPVIADPWDPPSAVLKFAEVPLATVASKCACAWGGTVSVDVPAGATVIDES